MSGTVPDLYDVAVIGGGPAGATVATFLAQFGRRVVVFEKQRHPRFHIGESLLPKNLPILESLGVAAEVAAIGVYKSGAEFVSPNHDRRQAFHFSDALDPEPDHAYQVHRSQFDEILLRNARTKGAEVRENCVATDFEAHTGICRLTVTENGVSEVCSARFAIDASGRDCFLSRRVGTRIRDRNHNSAAIFAHFEGVSADAWATQGNIAIYFFDHGWIWMIPLPGGLTSIGAVCMPDYLKTRSGSLDDFFLETLRLAPKVWEVLSDARATTPVRGAGNYSYKADRAYGDRFLLLGDAYAFIDPVFSSGVYLAMSGAEVAATAVHRSLDEPGRANTLFEAYQRHVDRRLDRLSWIIHRFNMPAMRNLFMLPRDILGIRSAVISLLAGNISSGYSVTWRLALFKALYLVRRIIEFRRNRLWAARQHRVRSISMPEDEVTERS